MLVTLICDEVGETGIGDKLHELLMNSSLLQEWVVRPFARSYLRQPPRAEITVRRLPNNTLGVLLRSEFPEDIHDRIQFFQATIPRNSFGNGASSKEIEIRGFELKNTGERESNGDFFLELSDDMG